MNWFFQSLQKFKEFGRFAGRVEQPKLNVAQFPPILSGQTVYAIGDIHGRLDLLRAIHAKIDEDWTNSSKDDRKIEIYLAI